MKNVDLRTAKSRPLTQESVLQKFKFLKQKMKRSRTLKTFIKTSVDTVKVIQECPFFNNLLCKWNRDKQQDLKHVHSLELSVYNKSKMAYDTLKSRLIQYQLIDQPKIQSHIQKLGPIICQ
jgi:hypothetical protein